MKQKLFSPIGRLQLIAVLFFLVIYSLLSLVNHYNFRTYSLDLGIENNALYDYSMFHFNNCTLLQPQVSNYLSVHFEPIVMLFTPFRFLLGSYTLLVFQILFILFGGFGVFKYIREISSDPVLAFLAQLHFYFFYGIFSALNFDFHTNVIGAMLVPWFFYFFHLRKWKWAFLFFILLISTKENMSLWMSFVCAGIALLYWKDKVQRAVSVSFSILSFACFLLIIKVLMPAMEDHHEAYGQIRDSYSALGASMSEIVLTFFREPVRVLKLLFINPGAEEADYIKVETYIFVLLSGGILLFVRPQFIVMLIPIFAQKMFNNHYVRWGIADHYSIEFAPICSMGAFYVISKMRDEKWKKYMAFGVAFFSFTMALRSFDRSFSFFQRSRQRIYQSQHYQREYNVAEAHSALALIPPAARVSAQSPFVPHLAFRNSIYEFPVVHDADYIVFSFAEPSYPLTEESFKAQVAMFMALEGWNAIYQKNQMVILKRVGAPAGE